MAKKDEQILLRANAAEKRTIRRAAEAAGESVSEFLRAAGLARAEDVLEGAEGSREQLVDRLVANRRCPLPREDLERISEESLRNLSASFSTPPTYTGNPRTPPIVTREPPDG